MEETLLEIVKRCKQRDILFCRDWDSVTTPQLEREGPNTYMKINQMIKEGDQGVIQRVQQVVMNKVAQLQNQGSAAHRIDITDEGQPQQEQA